MPVQHTGKGIGREGLVQLAQQFHAHVVMDRLPIRAAPGQTDANTAFAHEQRFAETLGLLSQRRQFDRCEVTLKVLGDGFILGFARVEVEIHEVEP